jgi:hypothetical protein
MRDDPATGAVVKPDGRTFSDRFRPKQKSVLLFQEWLVAASCGEAIAFACRALPEEAEPAEIAVCAGLKQENLDFVNGRSMAAVLGNDFFDGAATGPPQVV